MSDQPATDPRQMALNLRKAGNSLGMISRALRVPKTTIHRWVNGLSGNTPGKQAPHVQPPVLIAGPAQPVAPSTPITTPSPRTYTRRTRPKPHVAAWQMPGVPVNQMTYPPSMVSTLIVPSQVDTGHEDERPQNRSMFGMMTDTFRDVTDTAQAIMLEGLKYKLLNPILQRFYPPDLTQQQSASAQSVENKVGDTLAKLEDFANKQRESRKQQDEFKKKEQEKSREENRKQWNEFFEKLRDVVSKKGTQDKRDPTEIADQTPTLADNGPSGSAPTSHIQLVKQPTDGRSEQSIAVTVALPLESIAKDPATAPPNLPEDPSKKSATGSAVQPKVPQEKSTTSPTETTTKQDMAGPSQQQQKPPDSIGNGNVADHLASASLNNQNGQQNASDQQSTGIALDQSREVQALPTQPILPADNKSPGSATVNNPGSGSPVHVFAKYEPANDHKDQGDNTNSQPGWWDRNKEWVFLAGTIALAFGVTFLKKPEKTQTQQPQPPSNNSGYVRDPNGVAFF